MARGEFYPLRWNELRARVVPRVARHDVPPRAQFHIGAAPSPRAAAVIFSGSALHAAGHDHFAIFRHRCANAASDSACALSRKPQVFTIALGINQGFRATERDKRDARRAVHCGPVTDGIGARWRSLAETEIRAWPLFRHEKDGRALQFTSLGRHFLRRKLRISRSHSTGRERVADSSLSIAGST